MDKIKTLTDMHLFADNLLYKLPNNELPSNVMIAVFLSPPDYKDFFDNFHDLPFLYQRETLKTEKNFITYQYMNVKFNIILKLNQWKAKNKKPNRRGKQLLREPLTTP